MFRSLVLICLVLSYSTGLAQSPNVSDPESMVKNSSLIVIGIVEEESLIVNRNKMATIMKSSQLASFAEYVVGRSVRLRVKEIIKGHRSVKTGNTINIFIPGWFDAEGGPIFFKRQTFLVSLSQLKGNINESDELGVHKPGEPVAQVTPFEPKSYFVVVGGLSGSIPVDKEHQATIANIKRIARRR